MNAVAMSASTARLEDEQFILLTTYRTNGEPVATPVCHVMHGNTVHLVTMESTWKAKRLRRNPSVLVAASDMRGRSHGSVFAGVARILSDEEVDRSPVFRRHGLVGAAFRRGSGAHWIVKPVQYFERIVHRHRFIAVEIELAPSGEAAA